MWRFGFRLLLVTLLGTVVAVTLWMGRPSVALLGACALALGVAMAVAVIFPNLGVFGRVLQRGQPGRNLVALTFDDGPSPATTPRVLELLEARELHATFFVIGSKAAQSPDLVRRILQGGHELACHGYVHRRPYAASSRGAVEADLRRAVQLLTSLTGQRPRWFRPPMGHVSPAVFAGAARVGLPIVTWTARALDGVSAASEARIAHRVLRDLSDGGIAMLHDASEREGFAPASLDALPRILDELQARGLRCVTLSELLGERGELALTRG